MRPPKRDKVRAICGNINRRIKIAAEFRVLADYCPREEDARVNLQQAEVIEAQVEAMRDTLYALFARVVIDQMLKGTPKEKGEISTSHA